MVKLNKPIGIYLAMACMALGLVGCSDEPELAPGLGAFRLTLQSGTNVGTADKPLPFSVNKVRLVLDIEALANRGKGVDTTYNGWVVIKSEPTGAIEGRPFAVKLKNGRASKVPINLSKAYGTVRLVAMDAGYQPPQIEVDCGDKLDDDGDGVIDCDDPDCHNKGFPKTCPAGKENCVNKKDDDGDGATDCDDSKCKNHSSCAPASACSNGLDDDRDGFIDEQDTGCFEGLPSDRSETGASGAAGASVPLYFASPTIYDVQKPVFGMSDRDGSPLKGERVAVNSGWMLVTRISTDGLYVTDFNKAASWLLDKDSAGAFTKQSWTVDANELAFDSIFVFNFNTPVNLQVGDCLTQIDGAVDEFFGYTELTKPFWKKGDFAFCMQKAKEIGKLSEIWSTTDKKYVTCPSVMKGACKTGSCPTNYDCNIAGDCVPTIKAPGAALCRDQWENLASTPVDLTKLMVDNDQGTGKVSVWQSKDYITERYEAGLVQLTNTKRFTTGRICDRNYNQVIDWTTQPTEKACGNACGDQQKLCTVVDIYRQYGQWTVSFNDGAGTEVEAAVVTAGVIADYNPMKSCVFSASDLTTCTNPAKTLTKVVGTMRHLVFGQPPWIIEPRGIRDCPSCVN